MAMLFNLNNFWSRILFAAFLVAYQQIAMAQGFLKQYPNTYFSNSANILEQLENGDYLMMGMRDVFILDSFSYNLVRSNIAGEFISLQQFNTGRNIYYANNRQWYSRDILEDSSGNPTIYEGFRFGKLDSALHYVWTVDIKPKPGEIIEPVKVLFGDDEKTWLVAQNVAAQDSVRLLIMRLGPGGQLLWQNSFPVANPNGGGNAEDIVATADGGLICSFFDDYHYTSILKVDANGQLQWRVSGGLDNWICADANSNALIVSRDTITAHSSGLIGQRTEARKIAPNGSVIWTKLLRDPAETLFILPSKILAADNGDLVILGRIEVNPTDPISMFFQRITSSGDEAVHKQYDSFLPYTPDFYTGLAGGETGFTFFGYYNGFALWNLDADGNFTANYLKGSIRFDENNNCSTDNGEDLLPYRVAVASINGVNYYNQSNFMGEYKIALPDGPFTATAHVLPLNYLWEPCIPSGQNIVFPDTSNLTQHTDLLTRPLLFCPLMQVRLSSTPFVACQTSNMLVQVCNEGTAMAENVEVDLLPLSEMAFDTAYVSHAIFGDTVRAYLGNMAPGECQTFYALYTLPCNPGALGSLHAHVRPDQYCGAAANWSGASLEARSNCSVDSVRFYVQNKGTAPTTQALDFIVIEDMVVMHTESIPAGLAPGAEITFAASNHGNLYRIIADQEASHPVPGAVSVAATDCASNISAQAYLQFPDSDGSPFNSSISREIEGTPPAMRVLTTPTGVGNERFVRAGTPLRYQLEFKNTGDEAINSITFFDSLSTWLEPAKIQVNGASHPYSWEIMGSHVLAFRFENIHLMPGASVYISFTAFQQENVPVGTVLLNKATLYADLSAPLALNLIWHTVGENFLPISDVQNLNEASGWLLSPNPALDRCSLTRLSANWANGQRICLRDMFGRQLWEKKMEGGSVDIPRNKVPAGVYIVEVKEGNRTVAQKKLIWQ